MDKTIFTDDDPLSLSSALWWLAWDPTGNPIGFAGLKRLTPEDPTTAYLCRCGVLENHRGHGLQRRLLRCRERWCLKVGITTAITYVHTQNPASLNSLVGAGYRVYEPEYAWVGRSTEFIYLRKEL